MIRCTSEPPNESSTHGREGRADARIVQGIVFLRIRDGVVDVGHGVDELNSVEAVARDARLELETKQVPAGGLYKAQHGESQRRWGSITQIHGDDYDYALRITHASERFERQVGCIMG